MLHLVDMANAFTPRQWTYLGKQIKLTTAFFRQNFSSVTWILGAVIQPNCSNLWNTSCVMRQKIVIFFRIVWFREFLKFCGKGKFPTLWAFVRNIDLSWCNRDHQQPLLSWFNRDHQQPLPSHLHNTTILLARSASNTKSLLSDWSNGKNY